MVGAIGGNNNIIGREWMSGVTIVIEYNMMRVGDCPMTHAPKCPAQAYPFLFYKERIQIHVDAGNYMVIPYLTRRRRWNVVDQWEKRARRSAGSEAPLEKGRAGVRGVSHFGEYSPCDE